MPGPLRIALLFAGLLLAGTPGSRADDGDVSTPATARLEAARRFLELLEPTARADASVAINAPDRTTWSYLPQSRTGLRLEALTPPQRAAWRRFLATAVTPRGLARLDRIRATEPVHDRGGGVATGPDVFSIRFHGLDGDPNTEPRAWAWRLEGHHLRIGETLIDGKVVSSTPFMLGSVLRHDDEGEVFEREDAEASSLLAEVPADRLSAAWKPGPVPGDMLTAMKPASEWRIDGGLTLDRAGETARARANRIVTGLLDLRTPTAVAPLRRRWEALEDAEIRFQWIGDRDRTRVHQWRLVSPVLVVEFAHSGGDTRHAHLALRAWDAEFPPMEEAWSDAP